MAKVPPVITWGQHSPLTQWWGSTDCQPGLRYGPIASYCEMHSSRCWHTVRVDNQHKSHVCAARLWHPGSPNWSGSANRDQWEAAHKLSGILSAFFHGGALLCLIAFLKRWLTCLAEQLYFEKASRKQSCHKSLAYHFYRFHATKS